MISLKNVRVINVLVLITLYFSLLFGCDSFQRTKIIEVRDGRRIVVDYDTTITGGEERKILIVRYQYPETVRKLKQFDNDAFDIWQGMKPVANEVEVDEAMIILTTIISEDQKKSIIYAADRTEVGDWTVKKVN